MKNKNIKDIIAEKALKLHKKLKGKLSIETKHPLLKKEDWNLLYTPGVGAVSSFIAKNPKEAREYTIKNNTVAVVSDGSAVLGLGNIGALGALPVMEGKAAIFKTVAGINAVPIVLDTQDPKEIIKTIKNISPAFGGINLEDFSAPNCFFIEEELKKSLSIPVMHDDQHGTAIVVLAGLINASKVVKKNLKEMKVVVVGAGAAGTAIAKLLVLYGIKNLIVSDSVGIIYKGRKGLSKHKKELAEITNPFKEKGNIRHALSGSDAVIGVTRPGSITEDDVKNMNEKAIVFALANPTPEIMPESAKRAGAFVIATGRSDFPNQINNVLAFPGIFKGALKNNISKITDSMKIKAAERLASMIKKPTQNQIIPGVMTPGLVDKVASVIKN